MSTNPGYVHISVRAAQKRAAAARRAAELGRAGWGNLAPAPQGQNGMHPMPGQAMRHNSPAESGGETSARGFVVYVGLDEETAANAGTSLSRLSSQVTTFLQTLVPDAQTHAAVALAPASAGGSNIDVVRQCLGDPTVSGNAPARAVPTVADPARHTVGVLIDLSRREVQLDGDILNLTHKEFELLNYLVENGSRTVGREELLESLWRGADEIPNERTIDVHIRRLRAKLGRLSNTVRTVRGQGYRFYDHPEVTVWAVPEYSI
ncbi:winged helix-turn-helix domain-containing protein [Pseudoglutamicibacter albus]|uniref:OmpR/PhoB-type domain-containing protein n=1 Tax=Pseudoglutamicibacter albus DNF00011 TaxID=1401063 RepID=A0A095ZRG5_9MICC|nr:winged helix-turn-helix domain-containing protein [Pseudoglutamicibacter albus]KGF21157.1 hypothetical protein HMPREF2128_02710 [Pseudoglutamicibacter albus DNF00011]